MLRLMKVAKVEIDVLIICTLRPRNSDDKACQDGQQLACFGTDAFLFRALESCPHTLRLFPVSHPCAAAILTWTWHCELEET